MSRSPRSTTIDPYWRHSALPFTSLIFVVPILLTYELGIVALGPAAMRNGAEQWLRQLLDSAGIGQYVLLPLLTCFGLASWHYVARQPWHFSWSTFGRMANESAILALGLLCYAFVQSSVCSALQLSTATAPIEGQGGIARVIGFCGAGFYEEVLFRLLLIPILAGLLRSLGESPRGSMWTAAIVSSVLFAAAHYRLFSAVGDPFSWDTFVFRCAAGMVFSALFIHRGFGITAGAHTLYDLAIACCW